MLMLGGRETNDHLMSHKTQSGEEATMVRRKEVRQSVRTKNCKLMTPITKIVSNCAVTLLAVIIDH